MRLLLPLAYVCGCAAAAAAPNVVGNNDGLQKRDVNGSFVATKAPYVNIWADITDREERSIQKFLRQQRNLTVPGDMEFDWYPVWLLAPNKTDATAYLDGKGRKPKRYARVLGQGDCYTREYMVGPLPVCSKTKAVPLDYANHGNATRKTDYCDEGGEEEEEEEEEFRVPGGNSTRMQNGPPGRPQREHPDERRKRNLDNVLQRRSPSNPYSEEQKWDGKKLPHDDKQPPVTILPDGARFEFDPEQNYVSWMGFTFYVATGLAGVSLHDVRFNGERVIYELAMQEALAHYAGPGESQNQASYLDVSIDFTTFNLIPGFDCPAYATYTKAFCLFEFPKDYPMSRHMDWEYYHATRNVAFMLRSISTVGNYDYQTTYEFHYDGTIQVIVRASGYIQGDDEPEDDQAGEYGYRIREDLSGSMHDHVLNFKADLDIKGTKNSLDKTEFVPNTQVYPWSGGALFNNMKAERSTIASEDEGKINWAPNSAAMYSVVNKDKPNEFGEYPGFRIFPSLGSAIHLTVQNSSVFPNKLNWATHHFYALAHKDEEPVAAHPHDGWSLVDPRTRFEDFFDGQSLEQEDIVLYFNLGMHHMPDTYDLPVTVFQGAQSGITLRPVNYQRSNNAASTRQQIHIENKGGNAVVEKYGVQDLSGSYDLGNANPQDTPVPEWDPEEHIGDGEDGDWE